MSPQSAMPDPPPAGARAASASWRHLNLGDLGWSVCLGLGTVIYLWFWPRDLNWNDESILLYEARRILEGDIPYRDFFEIVTPGAWYVMAGVFSVFGTTIEAARGAMSVLHALSVVTIYFTARALGLTRVFATLPALAYLTISFANLANASPHWFATFFALVILLALLAAPDPLPPSWMFGVGIVAGVLLAFQQQRGLAIAAAIPVMVLVDCWLARRAGGATHSIARLLGAYVGGGLVIGIPMLIYFLAVPGFGPAYAGLIHFPLFDYVSYIRVPWGWYLPFNLIALPWVVKYMPVLLPLGALVAWSDWRRGIDQEAVRRRTMLIIFCLFSIPTVLHCPDYLHLSLIAPFFFILATDLLGWIFNQVRAPTSQRLRFAVTVGLLAILTYQGARNLLKHRQASPFTHATAFGEVSFSDEGDVQFIDRLRQLVDASPSKEIFVFPHYPGIYLLTGAKNATRYSLLLPGYNPPEHFHEAVATLESKRTHYIVFGLSVQKPNEFATYLLSAYRYLPMKLTSHRLFERIEP